MAKGKFPSRDRYEKNNPTVSARIPAEVKEKLIKYLKENNISLANALKILAGELELKTKSVEEAKQTGYDSGFKDGYVAGRKDGYDTGYKEGYSKGLMTGRQRYGVPYRCHKCGETLVIDTPEEKAAAGEMMAKAGWVHKECNNTRSTDDQS